MAYVTNRSGVQEIWLRNRTDGSERLIVSERQFGAAEWLFDCAISPDATRVAYRIHQGRKIAIWVSPLSGVLQCSSGTIRMATTARSLVVPRRQLDCLLRFVSGQVGDPEDACRRRRPG